MRLAVSSPAIAGPVSITRQFDAGQSNPTYLLQAGDRPIVLRKQPYGTLLPRAHDVLRESRIMTALAGAGYPVPAPLLSGDGMDAVGTAYFIMDYVPGKVESNPALPGWEAGERSQTYLAMAQALADLHQLPADVLASAGVIGRPDFLGRQIKLWQAQFEASITHPDPSIGRVAQWLGANRPPQVQPSVVHGDFRMENFILQGTGIAAVLDWELCAIGDPLSDLAYCCLWHHLPPDVLNGLAGLPLDELGIPDQATFAAMYTARSGRPVEWLGYYLAFAFFRLAAILQGVYRRAMDGNAASSFASTRGSAARFCLEQAEALTR